MIDRQIKKYIYSPLTPIKRIIGDFYQKKFDICLVYRDGNYLEGVVTIGDIKKAIVDGADPDDQVKNIINKNFIWAKESSSEAELKEILNKSKDVRRIPILNKGKQVVGIYPQSPVGYFRHKTVLVTGGAGYVGSILCRKLLTKDYRVIVLDKLLFGQDSIKDLLKDSNSKLIVGDISNINHLIQGIKETDFVIHLAGIVGDPASSLDPTQTMESNYFSTQALIELSKYFQVSRFIFASSCSVYGASEEILTEKSKLNPVSLYAKTKISSENRLLKMSDNYFHPVVLRFGTIYGLSPRMRFDLVVNIMTANAFFKNKIYVNSGSQWRPLLHVADAAEACLIMLERPIDKIGGQIFNVGSDNQNFKVAEIAKIIQKLLPNVNIIVQDKKEDERNYRVSFTKIKNSINFNTNYNLEKGIEEIIQAMKKGKFKNFTNPQYSNYLHLKSNDNK